MTPDWEILTVAAVNRTTRSAAGGVEVREVVRDDAVRLSVLADGQLRVATASGHVEGPAGLLPDALAAAAQPWPASGGFGTAPPSAPPTIHDALKVTDLTSLSWLSELGHDRADVRYRIQRADGVKSDYHLIEHWHVVGLHGRPLARVSAGSAALPGSTPEPDPGCWLLPPWVLSQLMLEPLLATLTGADPAAGAANWDAVEVYDPGWGGGVDMEGVPRVPTKFLAFGECVTAPVDRARHFRSGKPATGHAGLTAPLIRDVVVSGRSATPRRLPERARIVVDAARLSGDTDARNVLVGFRLGAQGGEGEFVAIAELRDLCELLRLGTWCGPWQRGNGQWTSQWLAMGDPERCLKPRRM